MAPTKLSVLLRDSTECQESPDKNLKPLMSTERPTDESPRANEPYCQASRFASEADAGSTYFKAQDLLLHGPDNDLSAYPLQLNLVWHVAVLGEDPQED